MDGTARADSVRVDEARSADLQAAISSHELVGQATGVLVALHRIGPDQAWELLRTASMHTNLKVSRLARCLVAAAAGEASEDAEALDVVSVHLLPAAGTRPPLLRAAAGGGSRADRQLLGVARDRLADERDEVAARADQAATARDRAADTRDRELGQSVRAESGGPLAAGTASAGDDRAASAEDRRRARSDRSASAVDRALAAEDRTSPDQLD